MKKLYLSLLGILLAGVSSSVFANCDFANSNYEQEWKEAYFWACNEGIISEQYINNAKLNQELSRIEMARMLNIFAMKLMGKEEDPSRNCNGYSDLNYNDSIIANRACHLGIMGIGINKFKPNDSVSRAEFGTVLSRILYGDTYNVTNGKYYEKHLKALKDNGVITNTNPSLKEKKGYVLLMLKRYIDSKNKENTKTEISYKSDGGYIMKNGTDITLSNNKDSITISSKITKIKYVDFSKGNIPWTDSLQGPCEPGYHIPSKDEAEKLIDIRFDIRKNDLYNTKNEGGRIVQEGSQKELIQNGILESIFGYDILGGAISANNGGGTYLTRTHNYENNGTYFLIMCAPSGSAVYVGDHVCGYDSLGVICFKTN